MKNIVIVSIAVLLVNCGTGNKIVKTDNNTIYNNWELSIINGTQVNSYRPIYLNLTADNKVNGFIGCNNLTGAYRIENGSEILFHDLGITRMACPETEMALEEQVLEVLSTIDNFAIVDEKLILKIGDKESLATFCKMNNNEIVNKYWKLVKLEGASIQMDENQEREQYFMLRNDGNLIGFAGCNQFYGQYELKEGNKISIKKNMAMTLMACPDLNFDESAFLKIFDLADNYTLNGDTLSLNVGKRAPLAVFKAVYF